MSEELPPPLVPAEVDLRDMDGFMLNVERLLASELWAVATGEEFKAAVGLWTRAWKQLPAASLPDDDRILAAFAGIAVSRWKRVKGVAMRGFVLCSDGRFYHHVLAEDAIRAWGRKESFRERGRRGNERRWSGHSSSDESTGRAPSGKGPKGGAGDNHGDEPKSGKATAQGSHKQSPKDRCGIAEGSHSDTISDPNALLNDRQGQGQGQGQGQKKEKEQEEGRDAAAYAFFGKVIKLKPDDFSRWKAHYPHIGEELTGHLESRDAWLATQDEQARRKWFMSTASWLAKVNADAGERLRQQSKSNNGRALL